MNCLFQRGGATNGNAATSAGPSRDGPAEKRPRVGDKPAAADANSNSNGSVAGGSETLPGISVAPKVSEAAAAAAAKNGTGHMNWMVRYNDSGKMFSSVSRKLNLRFVLGAATGAGQEGAKEGGGGDQVPAGR